MEINVPRRLSMCLRPRLWSCTATAKRKAEHRARATGDIKLFYGRTTIAAVSRRNFVRQYHDAKFCKSVVFDQNLGDL